MAEETTETVLLDVGEAVKDAAMDVASDIGLVEDMADALGAFRPDLAETINEHARHVRSGLIRRYFTAPFMDAPVDDDDDIIDEED